MEEKKADKPQSKHAVFTFGRMNPITTGHKKLIDAVQEKARKLHADHHIFLSHTQDSKKNPLSHKQKVHFARKMVPSAHVHDETHVKTALDAMHHLHKSGYTHIHMVVGGDRHQEFHNLLHKYKPEGAHVEVHSAGDRDPDSEGVDGMSASKMRSHAEKKEFSKFRHGVPNKAHAKELYHAVRKGMKLENFQSHFKALFLVGGPGSGKDFLINTALDQSNLLEVSLDKLVKAILDKQNIEELNEHQSIVVNGTAENLDKVVIAKAVLEHMGYETSMVYVYTTNEESKTRNDERIDRGSKTFSEEVRSEKYASSILNMHDFKDMFNTFLIYNNSNDFATINEERKIEVMHWLTELGESISAFLESENYKSFSKAFVKKVNTIPHQVRQVGNIPPPPKGMKRVKKNGFWTLVKEAEGIATSGKNSADQDAPESSPLRNTYQFGKKTGKKPDSKKKSATPPPNFYDQRMGAVPSGGIGLTVSEFTPEGDVIQEKTFEKFRKNISSITNNVDGE